MSNKNSIYGPTLKTAAAEKFTMKAFRVSRKEKSFGRKGLPVCAWGEPGIGKTELPNYLVKAYEEFFEGNICYIPMAQIEEKAELQGLPEIVKYVRDLMEGESEEAIQGRIIRELEKQVQVETLRTDYAVPSWIPQEYSHGKRGLLVIDDMNRADERIINTIMQLLQDGKLLGWSLPPEWEIYCTCNPSGGEYQVTEFDDAQMTRMVNFYQEFDEKSWLVNWAEPTEVHSIAKNFIVSRPENATLGKRTNPRSFDKFFRMIEEELDLISKNGADASVGSDIVKEIHNAGIANIDLEPLASFVEFITNGFGKLPEVSEILTEGFDLDAFYDKLDDGNQLRLDIIATIDTRIMLYAKNNPDKHDAIRMPLTKWIKHPKLNSELRYKSAQESAKTVNGIIDEEITEIIFSRFNLAN